MKPATRNIALLGYLVFFLNLGPSFHRAPIFGLHDHGSHSVLNGNDPCVCSCGHDHGPTRRNDLTENDDSKAPDFSIEKQPCDCSLCRFFKQYNVSNQGDDAVIHLQLASGNSDIDQQQVSRLAVRKTARGPPTA